MELCKGTDCDVIDTKNPVYHRGKPVFCYWNLATMEVNKKKIVVVILLILKENGIILRDPLASDIVR